MTSLIAIANEASRTVAEQRHHREQRELARRSRVDDRRTTRSAGPAAGAHCSTVPSVRHGVRRGSSGKVSKTIAKRKPHRGRSATPAGDDGADAMVTDSDSVLYSKARAQTSGTRVPTSKPSAPPVPIEPPAQWPSQKTPPGLAIVAFTASPAGPSTSPPRNSPPFLPVTPPADDPRPTHRKGTAVAPSSTPPLSAPRSRSTRPTSERPVRKDVRLGLGRKVMSAVYTPSQTLPLKQKPFKAPLVRPHPAKAAPETILQPHPAHRPAPTLLVTTARASLPKNAAPITPEDSQPRLLRSSADDEDEDMEETKEADSSYGELGIDPEAVEEAMKPHD
ncbi:hypothetical protein EVJ58_g2354 [Rhodofomes roseus]|uniref:Uncharacterized protein n=1 Tax=Rhodofomes roseus TaxID=34475 RepID=A0A4Y9YR27_9APHY|nr:hypothetical protein EVJ58_g2354 [Rhodofomes roseus]